MSGGGLSTSTRTRRHGRGLRREAGEGAHGIIELEVGDAGGGELRLGLPETRIGLGVILQHVVGDMGFVDQVAAGEGVSAQTAGAQVDAAIDRWVWYAGWTDKLAAVLGSSNPVAGPYFNVSMPEPSGVVAAFAPRESSLLGLVSVIAPALAAGTPILVLDLFEHAYAIDYGSAHAKYIDAFFARTGIEFREDASNRDTRWTRNRIRHELVPVLEQVMQRPVRQAVMNATDLLRAESDFVDASELALGPLPEQLEVAALRALPLALQRRRMYRWLCERGISNVSFELVESALALLTQRVPAKRNLPGGAFVRRRNGIIFCERE
jgi:hypothetical protein